MRPELVDSERLARGDGTAIKSGVKILESRLDMTKRAQKNVKLWKLKYQNDITSRHLPHLEETFIFFLPELIF